MQQVRGFQGNRGFQGWCQISGTVKVLDWLSSRGSWQLHLCNKERKLQLSGYVKEREGKGRVFLSCDAVSTLLLNPYGSFCKNLGNTSLIYQNFQMYLWLNLQPYLLQRIHALLPQLLLTLNWLICYFWISNVVLQLVFGVSLVASLPSWLLTFRTHASSLCTITPGVFGLPRSIFCFSERIHPWAFGSAYKFSFLGGGLEEPLLVLNFVL